MANELTVTGQLTFAKGNVVSSGLTQSAKKFTVAGTQYIRKTQIIGTTAEAIVLGDVTTPGWFFIYNMDTTNYVEILDSAAGVATLRIKAGEFALGRFTTAAPAAKANTAACSIEYMIVDD